MTNRACGSRFPFVGVVTALSLSAALIASGALGQAAAPKAFATAQQAADALVKAAGAGDLKALQAIFGPGSKDIIPSGDPVQDKQDLARFAERARQKMTVSSDPNNASNLILVVGADDWPMPVPIVKGQDGKWRFDAAQGSEEILARRIGSNELDAILLLRGYVEAQHEYASELRDGATMRQYAQKFISTPGKQDGLSWKLPDGTHAGPAGDAVARALAEGYTDKSQPFNGYHFRILTAQGPSARLGQRNYIFKGMMIGGFAAVAWPANYGVSGIQTFLVNHDGLVYQKDLGPETATLAAAITTFDPDKTWLVTEDEP
ncbi:MAG TPA: DUF2950 domain-containing protein [Thermoanaerobaculia bacterium]